MPEGLGEDAYQAYWHHSGGKSLVSGETLPTWLGLPAATQEAWEAAADAVLEAAGYNDDEDDEG